MLSTEQALKYLEEKHKAEAEPAQPVAEPGEEPKDKQPESESHGEVPREEPKGETESTVAEKEPEESKAEEKPTEEKEPEQQNKKEDKPSKVYSHEERVKHSFAREKERRKNAERENKALKSRNEELEKELEKYKGLTLEDFGNKVEDYTDYRLREQSMRNEIEQNKRQIESSEAEMARAENERRVSLSFETDAEKEEYYELLDERGKDFEKNLSIYDPDNVVLNYLGNCEQYPKVLKVLMTDMKALGYVFQDANPNNRQARLHSLAMYVINGNPKQEAKPQETKAPEQPKKAMPVIGKQVTASSAPRPPVHDHEYWNNYLKMHKHR